MDTNSLTTQVVSIIDQLHGVFDDIGVPTHERDAREGEVQHHVMIISRASLTKSAILGAQGDARQPAAARQQVRYIYAEYCTWLTSHSEKREMTEEAQHLIKVIKQMEQSLDDSRQHNPYELESPDMKVTYPLMKCVQALKEKYNTVAKLHRERFEQVKTLVQALESYASHLEPAFVQIKLPPTSPSANIPPTFDLSPNYVSALDTEFTRVYEEYNRRISIVQALADEIIKLWAELGTPQAQTDAAIVQHSRDAPEQLGLHTDDVKRLKARRDKLVQDKVNREKRLQELRATVEGLWDRLGVEEPERKAFLAANRGCGLRSINEFEDELSRLNELKRQNLHLFVEDARCKLQELWDALYFSEEEMLEFTPAFSDVYSDALLSAHEAEIARLEALQEQRAPTLQMIDKHRSLIKEREDLEASSKDASRLLGKGAKGEKRDPTRLLREEKMRKRITKDLPKVEADLRRILESWEEEYGRPFLVHGERYVDELDAAAAAAASSKAPPARSKTPAPSGPPPSRMNSAKSNASSSRGTGTVRGAPPPRSKTPTCFPTANNSTLGMSTSRNPFASSVSQPPASTASKASNNNTSPSRIPARVPLGKTTGNKSPERHDASTIRKMGPPRAPPPKMKDLFVPPTPQSTYEADFERSASIVRQMPPEDVYDDRGPPRFNPNASVSHQQMLHQQQRYYHSQSQPEPRPAVQRYDSHQSQQSMQSMDRYHQNIPGSRQISNSSSMASHPTGTSGSENWETYDSASEAGEQDIAAEDAYYARLRLQASRQGSKRLTPEGYDDSTAKRFRAAGHPGGMGTVGHVGLGVRGVGKMEIMVENEERSLVPHGGAVDGSEAGWTDDLSDGRVGETY